MMINLSRQLGKRGILRKQSSQKIGAPNKEDKKRSHTPVDFENLLVIRPADINYPLLLYPDISRIFYFVPEASGLIA